MLVHAWHDSTMSTLTAKETSMEIQFLALHKLKVPAQRLGDSSIDRPVRHVRSHLSSFDVSVFADGLNLILCLEPQSMS